MIPEEGTKGEAIVTWVTSDLIEEISDAYHKYSERDTVIICRSNKRANQYNRGIRKILIFTIIIGC